MSDATDQKAQAPGALALAALATAALPGLEVLGVKDYARWDDAACATLTCAGGQELQAFSVPASVGRDKLERMFRTQARLGDFDVAQTLPFAVPRTRGVVDTGDGAVVVIDHMGGQSATTELFEFADAAQSAQALANSLGAALASLHRVSDKELRSFLTHAPGASQVAARFTELVRKHRDQIPSSLRERWLAVLENPTIWNYENVLVHGGLRPEQLQVVAGGAVVGVRGFADAGFSDPALDVMWLTHAADAAFFDAFLSAYARASGTVDLHLAERARALAELQTLDWYDQGVQAGDEQWIELGQQALRQMALDLDGELLVATPRQVEHIQFTPDEEPMLKLSKHAPIQGSSDAKPGGSDSKRPGAHDSGLVGDAAHGGGPASVAPGTPGAPQNAPTAATTAIDPSELP